jgi:hypothetical protein
MWPGAHQKIDEGTIRTDIVRFGIVASTTSATGGAISRSGL